MKSFHALALLSLLVLSACARGSGGDAPAAAVSPAPPAGTVSAVAPVMPAATVAPATPASANAAALPAMIVHRDPNCGCCEMWTERMRHAGFVVEVRDEPQLDQLKKKLGIPDGKTSCHTAEVGGYVIEGHVPAEDIKRLLAEKSKARGLVLPGMPMGSPGMGEGSPHPPYTVELLDAQGQTSPYATHSR